MKRYIVFLRGINVSGQKVIKMEALKEIFNKPAYKNVSTYIQSGNVLFDSKKTETAALQIKIEKLLQKHLGYEVKTVVRSQDEIIAAIAANPFQTADLNERKLYVTFLSEVPNNDKIPDLHKVMLPGEELSIIGKDMFIVLPKFTDSKLTNAYIEKKLGVIATNRNWTTVNRVATL